MERPLRLDSTEFVYNVQDARAYSNRPVNHGVQYAQDQPALNTTEILNSYRGGPPYGYAPRQFYPAVPNYGSGYTEEYVDYGLNPSTSQVLNHDSVNIVPYTWPPRKQTGPSTVYVDSELGYAYGSTASLVHRPAHTVTTDAPNFSFPSMPTHLPATSVLGSDRLLPTPVSKVMSGSSGLLYSNAQSLKAPTPVTTAAPSVLTSAGSVEPPLASYSASFDTSGLPYSSATTHIANHQGHPNRTTSVTYSASGESLFQEHDQNLRSHNSAVDLSAYAYTDSGGSSIRRGSGSSSQTSSGTGTGTGSSLSSGQAYTTTDPGDDQMAQGQVHHHHQQQQQQQQQSPESSHHHPHLGQVTATVASGTATSTYLPEAAGVSGVGGIHADNRGTIVGARH